VSGTRRLAGLERRPCFLRRVRRLTERREVGYARGHKRCPQARLLPSIRGFRSGLCNRIPRIVALLSIIRLVLILLRFALIRTNDLDNDVLISGPRCIGSLITIKLDAVLGILQIISRPSTLHQRNLTRQTLQFGHSRCSQDDSHPDERRRDMGIYTSLVALVAIVV
jgi:hypothetical protein